MAKFNDCRFEGTLWNPELKTTTTGKSLFKAKLSVFKEKVDGKNVYQPIYLRAFGNIADQMNFELRQEMYIFARGLLKLETNNERTYLTLYVNEFGEAEREDTQSKVENNSPYARSYKPQQNQFETEITSVLDDGLPF